MARLAGHLILLTQTIQNDTDIKGWLVGPDTSRGVGGLASLSSSPCPHTNSPWSFYNKEGGFTVDSEIDVRLTNVP